MKKKIRDLVVGDVRSDDAVLEETAPMKGGARTLKWRRTDGGPSYQVLAGHLEVTLKTAEKPGA